MSPTILDMEGTTTGQITIPSSQGSTTARELRIKFQEGSLGSANGKVLKFSELVPEKRGDSNRASRIRLSM